MRVLLVVVALLGMMAPARADKVVTLSAEEIKALMVLLDIAVKSGGLPVAGNADFLARKVETAPDLPKVDKGSSPPAAGPSSGDNPPGGSK